MRWTRWPAVILWGLMLTVGCSQSGLASTGEGGACESDGNCDSYYRCIDEHCAVPPAMSGERDEQTPVARFFNDDELVATFYLELATTEEEQQRGLMYRPTMLDDWGMLFIYDDEQHLSFWMKNTLISLDMIFVDGSGVVVGVVEEAEPETLRPRSVGRRAQYVLEINGGLAGEHGIDAGTKMSLTHVDEHL